MGIIVASPIIQTIVSPIRAERPWELLPSENKRLFGSRIRKLREERGFSQAKLAEKMDANPKYVSNLESGYSLPPPDQFFRLAKGLGMTMSELTRETWDKIYDSSLS